MRSEKVRKDKKLITSTLKQKRIKRFRFEALRKTETIFTNIIRKHKEILCLTDRNTGLS